MAEIGKNGNNYYDMTLLSSSEVQILALRSILRCLVFSSQSLKDETKFTKNGININKLTFLNVIHKIIASLYFEKKKDIAVKNILNNSRNETTFSYGPLISIVTNINTIVDSYFNNNINKINMSFKMLLSTNSISPYSHELLYMLNFDKVKIINGENIEVLYSNLWQSYTNLQWERAYENFEKTLSALNPSGSEKWGIWVDWYTSIVKGQYSFNLPEKIADAVDRRIALGDGRQNFWNRKPEDINREIAGWVEEAKREAGRRAEEGLEPGIPAQILAPLQTAVEDNRVVEKVEALSFFPKGTGQLHQILRTETDELAERLRGQAPDAARLLTACHQSLGPSLKSLELYAVGYYWIALGQISTRIDEMVLDDAAGRFAGLLLNLGQYLNQFDEWVEYNNSALKRQFENNAKPNDIAALGEIKEIITNEGSPVSNSVSNKLDKLQLAIADGHPYNLETVFGFAASLSNVLQSLGEIALQDFRLGQKVVTKTGGEWVDQYKKDFWAESTKWAARGTITIGTTTAIEVFRVAAIQLTGISVSYPSLFGWLTPLLRYLGVLV